MDAQSKFSKFADDVFVAVAGYVARCVTPLLARIEALEKRPPERGEKGLTGEPGPAGNDGRDGRDGEPGRDAFAIDVLPEIDETRTYQRGTWATHAGGLWVARSRTEGMNGWSCVVVGVASMEVVSNGARNFSVKALLSDGQSSTAEFVVPAMIHHGIWKQGTYEAGDAVTWDGGTWLAEKETSKKPGSLESSWRLIVKAGRPGKDGKDGSRGERGPEGRAGKDHPVWNS